MTPNKLANARMEIVEAYKNGVSLKALAALHSVSTGTVRNLLVEEGVARRPRGRTPKPVAIEAE